MIAEKAASARREVRDALSPGLRLIVQTSGFKSWSYRYTVGGRDRRLAPVSLDAARKAANAARADVHEGRDPAADKATAKAPANSVLAAFKDYDRDYLSYGREYIDHETEAKTRAAKAKPKIGTATAAGTRSFFIRRVLPIWARARPVRSAAKTS